MYLSKIEFKNHPFLKNLKIDFLNHETKKPYKIVVFVGENGSGKTTLLNEILNYSDSKYIVNKESSHYLGEKDFNGIYVRQDLKYAEAMNSISNLIDGKGNIFKTKTEVGNSALDQLASLRTPTAIIHPIKGKKLVDSFHNENITNAFINKDLSNIKCGSQVIRKINGINYKYDIDKMSSGEQEILLKIMKLRETACGTDYILYDEPETSLHPRWQKIIMNFLISCLESDNGSTPPQMFIATHSERIMESIVNNKDALIIRLSNDNGEIKPERIEEMNLCLPQPTFAELDYVIFKIPSVEYVDQLLAQVSELAKDERVYHIDKYIRSHKEFNPEIHQRVQEVNNRGNKITYYTLPIYIRNSTHHPENKNKFTEDDVITSIELLQKILKSSKK